MNKEDVVIDTIIDNLEGDIDHIDLLNFLIELATSNTKEYNDKLYSAFLKFDELKILLKDEKKLISFLINTYDTINKFPEKKVLEEKNYINLSDSKKSKIEEKYMVNGCLIEQIVDEIISARIVDSFIKENKIEENIENSTVSLDLIYKVSDFKNELLQFNADDIQNDLKSEVNLYTGIQYIDERYGKIPSGSIVSIIKNKNCSNFVEASIIYNTLSKEMKNICVMTSNWTTKDIIAKILVLHSQTLEEEKRISYKAIHSNEENIQKIKAVYEDFLQKFGSHLQVYCNTSLKIFNIGSFRNLLSTANQLFKETTNSSMDMLMIDTIDNFRSEAKGSIESNTDKIIKNYCNLIIREVKMFEGLNSKNLVAVISTNSISKETYSIVSPEFDIKNNVCYQDFKIGTNMLEKYSDLVLVVATDNIRTSYNNFDGRFQVIKSRDTYAMDESVLMTISLVDCSIAYHLLIQPDEFDAKLRLNNMSDFYSQHFFPVYANNKKQLKSSKKQ